MVRENKHGNLNYQILDLPDKFKRRCWMREMDGIYPRKDIMDNINININNK